MKLQRARQKIPQSPLRTRFSKTLIDPKELEAFVADHKMWRSSYTPQGDSDAFLCILDTLALGDLCLTSVVHSPMNTQVTDSPSHSIFIPFEGQISTHRVNGRKMELVPSELGLLAPPGDREGQGGGCRSIMIMNVDGGRLKNISDVMMGGECKNEAIAASLCDPVPIDLGAMGGRVLRSLAQVLQMVGPLADNPSMMLQLGMDDVIYRHIAMLLMPTHSEQGETHSAEIRGPVERVCQWMLGHLDQKITLTDLERISGLSARSLQYAFLKRFGCSPFQWLKGQRLDAVHDKLRAFENEETITRVAFDHGFTRMGSFSDAYKERFGVSPQVTHRQK